MKLRRCFFAVLFFAAIGLTMPPAAGGTARLGRDLERLQGAWLLTIGPKELQILVPGVRLPARVALSSQRLLLVWVIRGRSLHLAGGAFPFRLRRPGLLVPTATGLQVRYRLTKNTLQLDLPGRGRLRLRRLSPGGGQRLRGKFCNWRGSRGGRSSPSNLTLEVCWHFDGRGRFSRRRESIFIGPNGAAASSSARAGRYALVGARLLVWQKGVVTDTGRVLIRRGRVTAFKIGSQLFYPRP